MKILQVATVATTINAFLIPFARAFQQCGWEVHAAAEGVRDLSAVVESHDKCFDISFSRNPLHFYGLWKSLITIRALLKEEKYDVVHVHTPIAAFITRFSAIGLKKTKVFYTAHGFHCIEGNPKWKNFFFILMEKISGFFTDHLFVINSDDFDLARKYKIVDEQCLSFISGIGVDTHVYDFDISSRNKLRTRLNIKSDTFVLLQVAEVNKNKNHEIVIQALSEIKNEISSFNFKYLVVGDGPLLNKIKIMADRLELNDYIEFLGRRSDIKALMSSADVVCLSSHREGLPRCLLEAMCAKRAIIASDIRGCRDLLKHGSGILVSPNDYKEWISAIIYLQQNEDLRVEMGNIGYKIANEQYEIGSVIDSVLSIYRN
ncbi:TPA: glycosyltransferase family 4 protein [Vibrio vulnificus]|nr:glycosyltransferase family 4 protein [Vibrio vulnificus]